jgi:hypothetical protein
MSNRLSLVSVDVHRWETRLDMTCHRSCSMNRHVHVRVISRVSHSRVKNDKQMQEERQRLRSKPRIVVHRCLTSMSL